MIYLDNSATAPIFPEVADTIAEISKNSFYNISSSYSPAIETEKLFESAAKTLAEYLNCKSTEIVFTSGGTESDNTALSLAPKNSEIIVSAVEHHAILNCERTLKDKNVTVKLCPVEKDGTVNPETLTNLITENTSLVSIMHVNNELGSVNDIESLVKAVKAKNKNILFHSDGVQAFMHVCTDMKKLGVDLYSVSAHKVHGPKGVGALFVKTGVPFKAFIQGGGQQRDMRSGTVNVPGYVGFARAVEMIGPYENFSEKLNKIKQAYISAFADTDYIVPLCPKGAPNILALQIKGVRASTIQNALENSVLISKGSACTSRASKISHVLEAINMPVKDAENVIRLSFGYYNTLDEVNDVAAAIKEAADHLRRYVRK